MSMSKGKYANRVPCSPRNFGHHQVYSTSPKVAKHLKFFFFKTAVIADMFTMLPKTTSHSKVVFNANSRWDLQALTSSTERSMKSIFYGTTKARSSPCGIINLLQEVLS